MKMIKERFMVTGKQFDTGETVTGHIIAMPNTPTVKIAKWVRSHPDKVGKEQEFEVYYVDPATVEPVAVKPIRENENAFCPNCGKLILKAERTEYCGKCGQRIDWTVYLGTA